MRIAIHAHVFYPELWSELLGCITNFIQVCGRESVFAVVTCPEGVREDIVRRGLPECEHRIVTVPNRGYDIGPFVFEFLNKIELPDFDLVVKLHTKRDTSPMWINYRPFRGPEWRRALLSFCSTEAAARRTVRAFSKWTRQGMVAARRVINFGSWDCRPFARQVNDRMTAEHGLRASRLVMVAGTMFAVRASALSWLQHKYVEGDFVLVDKTMAHKDYGLSGWLELMLPQSVDARGLVVSEGTLPPRLAVLGYWLQSVAYGLMRTCSSILRRLVGPQTVHKMVMRIQAHG